MIYIIFISLVIAVLLILIAAFISSSSAGHESGARRAGRLGEEYVTELIEEVLNEDDVLLTNIEISIDDREAEFDNIIINSRGIFIIEAKNYSGELYGDEDDYEWEKVKVTDAGNAYEKTVKNPIKQVKRQIYLLASFLKQYGISVWVEGYVYLTEQNSPIDSDYILESQDDIDYVIHEKTNIKLSAKQIDEIVRLLK